MLFYMVLLSVVFTTAAIAQTPDGFQPSVVTPLTIQFPRNITVAPAGVLLQRAGTLLST
jgi:hypothetical protein